MNITLIDLKSSDLKELKRVMYELNGGKCPLLGVDVDFDSTVVDHEHKLKSEEPSISGKGLVRNALEFRANALEGKITNNWKRYFGADVKYHPCKLSDYLRNLADYLEQGPFILENQAYIHPSEVVRQPNLKKSSYNKLKKIFLNTKQPNNKKTFPEYPKSKKMTKTLEKLYTIYSIEPEFYKG